MKRIFSILLAVIMMLSVASCLSVGAVSTSTDDEVTDINDNMISGEYELGAVLVLVKKDSPSVETLLADFEIAESEQITLDSSGQSLYYVKFAEKTEEIVKKAIAVLSESPYVIVAEPNYYAYIDDNDEYELGAVLVLVKKDSPSVETLLADFEIAESEQITLDSSGQSLYYVKFAEKTEEIVWKAISVLNESPYVIVAEPNYFAYVDPPVEDSTTEAPTQAASVAQPTTTTSEDLKSSTSDTAKTAPATSDTVINPNSNGTVQTGQSNLAISLTLLLVVSAVTTALFFRFKYRD